MAVGIVRLGRIRMNWRDASIVGVDGTGAVGVCTLMTGVSYRGLLISFRADHLSGTFNYVIDMSRSKIKDMSSRASNSFNYVYYPIDTATTRQ